MVPCVVEFESNGNEIHMRNAATLLLDKYEAVGMETSQGMSEYTPKLLAIYPLSGQPDQPLFFDPPPMAA